ncbi:maestro heat-like repeat-containing protein family member 7 [Anomalospiza imberbis]|uniref:maestro heat-like repeat-containing protein family member 7 n=1 Tax=Anomalospiza imberbis TaxID=187417 RepID=UPI00358EC201
MQHPWLLAIPQQLICKFIKRIRQEETFSRGAGLRAYPPIFRTKTSAALLYMLVEEGFYNAKQVPAMVRYIHQWLMANDSAEHRLNRTLLHLAEAQPNDAAMTLLRVAPSCDRAAMAMWKTIMSSPRTAKLAQRILLDVLGSWPKHSTCTSDGDKTGVFALAATVVMWKILQEPCVPHIVKVHSSRLLVHLLFQVFFSTEETPEEVDTFWKGCQEQHGLATSPNRFAVRTLKSLLCLEQYKDVVMAKERRCGWDTLLCADTQHYAVGLLAREMRHACLELCCSIALHLLWLLSTQEPCWDLPALAFLVEVLECLDSSECGDSVVEVSSRYLQSECRERRRLALRALLELIDDPSMAEKMWSLTESLMDLLWDSDAELAGMTLIALSFIFLHKYILMSTPIALPLAEALVPLFDQDNSQVQLLSITLFRDTMGFLEKEEKPLERPVHQSLLPLFFHCHDENGRVAEASRETLLCVAEFLKRRDLERLVKKEKFWIFANCLLEEDRSRVAEHLRRALPYLDSPQEPLREAAVRFMGMAGVLLMGQQEELHALSQGE